VLVALAGVAFGGYGLRVRSIEARSRELETQVHERTAELQREIDQRLRIEAALRESEREQAVAEERGRLARELHDAVTQTLFSASLIAEVLPRIWEKNQERGRQQLEEVRTLTRGALAEMRTLLLELRPEAIIKAKMEDLLRQLARAMMGRTGVPVDVSIEGECRLPSEVQVALYRIAQEALNNTAKHADASRVEVSLRCMSAGGAQDGGPTTTDDRRRSYPFALDGAQTTDGSGVLIDLRVSDDGRGFDPSEVAPGHFGLGIMRERAEAVGATLEVESVPGQGTAVVVVWAADEGRMTNQ
jgi:signal transduction histidine kinase